MNRLPAHERRLMKWIAAYAFFAFWAFWLTTPARAHDYWQTGAEVPSWVKASCCGAADAHQLDSTSMHARADGWHIDGISTVVAYDRTLPSQDGQFWAFYPVGMAAPPVYCLFTPAQGF